MSNKVRPQDDFYNHMNKEWLDEAVIPDGYGSWGSFEMIYKQANENVNKIIKELISSEHLSADNSKLVNLYNNFLNHEARRRDGIKPLAPALAAIDNFTDKRHFTALMAQLEKDFHFGTFQNKYIDSDFKDSNLRALTIGSMGLGMSNREFYERSNPRHEEIKQAYEIFINSLITESKLTFKNPNMFELIFNFEDKIAKHMLKPEELRDPARVYNVMSIDEIQAIAPFLNWSAFLHELQYDKVAKIIVSQPQFLTEVSKLVDELSLEDLKDFLKFSLLRSASGILTPELYLINFNFKKVFTGVSKMLPDDERAVQFVDNYLGEIIAKEYIKRHFSEHAKQDVLKMVRDLLATYVVRIENLDWMSPATKAKAIEKVNSFTIKIGYPDKWEDYSDVEIKAYEQGGSLYANIHSLYDHEYAKEIRDITKPVDRDKWYMYAQTVNAYYNPSTNEICFPAGILQKPFYSETQSHAANLGGIGAVIGHEVSHGFDDQGSQFDKDGNFENWWLEQDHAEYSKRTQAVVEQYNQYELVNTKINGKLTCGENIGDLSGVSAALDICKAQAPNDLKAFFENYALIWKRKSTPEKMNHQILTDPHSPEIFRCNGVLVNIDEFHELYDTKPGDQMYKPKEERVKVW